MPSSPFWNDPEFSAGAFGGVWDLVSLDTTVLPGLCDVTCDLTRKVDARSAPGSNGGTIVDKGLQLATVEVKVRLWTQDQYDEWRDLAAVLIARRNATRGGRPFRIYYPSLDDLGVRKVTLLSIAALRPAQPKGVWEATLKFHEFAPPLTSASATHRATSTPAQADLPTDGPNQVINPPPSTTGAARTS